MFRLIPFCGNYLLQRFPIMTTLISTLSLLVTAPFQLLYDLFVK